MYSDLLDVLGGGGGGGLRNNHSNSDEKHVALKFKAGKMNLALQENGKYWVTPDTRRGELMLVWQDAALKWEWVDRRHAQVPVDSFVVGGGDGMNATTSTSTTSTFARIPTPNDQERVYLYTSSSTTGTTPERTMMYWMQDADASLDDDIVAQVNQYLMNPQDAAPERDSGMLSDTSPLLLASSSGGGGGRDAVEVARGSSTTATTTTNATATSTQQVDALSNILENLGMPQQQQQQTMATTTTSTATPVTSSASLDAPSSSETSVPTGTLTLADLQGAMAGLATASPTTIPTATTTSSIGPPLSEVLTPASVTELLQHDDVRARLLQLLPPDQQSEQYLEENLRSPQVQSTLRVLSQILLPDDAGSLEGYHSMIANFQLNATDGEATLLSERNPIQAFLDCIVASVEKEQQEETKEETKEADGDDAMQE